MQTGFSLDCVTLFRLFLPMKVYSLRLLTPIYHDSVIFSRSSFLMVFGKFWLFLSGCTYLFVCCSCFLSQFLSMIFRLCLQEPRLWRMKDLFFICKLSNVHWHIQYCQKRGESGVRYWKFKDDWIMMLWIYKRIV